MQPPNSRGLIVRAIQDLPEDATVEDAMERLYFLAKVERGLEQSEGETISHEEVKARFLTTRHHAFGGQSRSLDASVERHK